jgi:hypothetical protein
VLGEALEMEFGVDLTIGPALEEGFYYDCYMGDKVRGLQLRLGPRHARRILCIRFARTQQTNAAFQTNKGLPADLR